MQRNIHLNLISHKKATLSLFNSQVQNESPIKTCMRSFFWLLRKTLTNQQYGSSSNKIISSCFLFTGGTYSHLVINFLSCTSAEAVKCRVLVNIYSLVERKGLHMETDMVSHSHQHYSSWYEVLWVHMGSQSNMLDTDDSVSEHHLCSVFTPWHPSQPLWLLFVWCRSGWVRCDYACALVPRTTAKMWFCSAMGKLSRDIWVTGVSVSSGLWPEKQPDVLVWSLWRRELSVWLGCRRHTPWPVGLQQ